MRGGFRQFVFQKSVFLKHPTLHSSLIIFVFRMKNTEEMFRYLDLNNQNNAIAFWSSFYLPNILLPHLMPGYK